MIEDIRYYILGLIIFFSWTAEAITGFGSIVIAVTLGSLLFELEELLPVLAPLNVFLGLYIAGRHRSKIDRPLLFKKILPLMLLGVLVGLVIFFQSPGEILKRIFGVLVILFSSRELYKRFFKPVGKTPGDQNQQNWLASMWIFLGGITHGIYASGGPLLVQGLAGLNRHRSVFRATLSSVWLVLNSFLVVAYYLDGRYNESTLKVFLVYLSIVPLSILTGEFFHDRISEDHFKIFVFTLLLIAGLALVF